MHATQNIVAYCQKPTWYQNRKYHIPYSSYFQWFANLRNQSSVTIENPATLIEAQGWIEYFGQFVAADVDPYEPVMDIFYPIIDDVSQIRVVGSDDRSEERRVGKECWTWCISRWSPYH